MTHETELKFVDCDFSQLRDKLRFLHAVCKGRHLERNRVFDTPDRAFKNSDRLLRLRSKMWTDKSVAVLTLKQPPACDVPDDVKVYDEQETVVTDFAATQRILESLGYEAAFRYDKVREEWTLDGVEICMDSMPFGDVVELEGEREAILQLARKLDLSLDSSSTGTYHDLNREYRKQAGLPHDDNFCFSEEQLNSYERELGVVSDNVLSS